MKQFSLTSQLFHPLNHDKTTSNSSNDLIKSIQELGKSIDMPSWEIQEFIQICTKLKYLKMGRDILQDYQKLRQDIYKLIEKRRSYMVKSFQILQQQQQQQQPYDNSNYKIELLKNIIKISEYSLKSWIAICRLRQLQWCPHPIKILINNIPTIFLVEYQTETALLINKLQQKDILFTNIQENWIYFLILITTSGIQHYDYTTIGNFFVENYLNFHLILDSHQFFINLMNEIILHEIQSNDIKEICHNLHPPEDSTGQQQVPIIQNSTNTTTIPIKIMKINNDIKEYFPILKIQYDRNIQYSSSSSTPPTASTPTPADQLTTTDLYIEGSKVLLYYFYSHYTKNSKRITIDSHQIHSNNLSKINEEFIAYNSRPITPLSCRIFEYEKTYQSKEKIRQLPQYGSHDHQKIKRPQSSPNVSKAKQLPPTFQSIDTTVSNDPHSPRRVDLNSSSHDEGTIDMLRTASNSSPLLDNNPSELSSRLTPSGSDSKIRKEYEEAGVIYDQFESHLLEDNNNQQVRTSYHLILSLYCFNSKLGRNFLFSKTNTSKAITNCTSSTCSSSEFLFTNS